MNSIAKGTPETAAMPRPTNRTLSIQELIRRLAEDVANGIMDAEADQMREASGNTRNGYRERSLLTCASRIALRAPESHGGFPEGTIERHQRAGRETATAAAVAEMYATGVSTRKAQQRPDQRHRREPERRRRGAFWARPGRQRCAARLAGRPLLCFVKKI